MQVISVVHGCLYFKLHNKRYLFGLTNSLAKDAAHSRQLKINHVILPSQSYVSSLSLFLWHTYALEVINCRSLVVADLSTKKRVESVMGEERVEVKWEFMQQHQLKQEYLLSVMSEQPTGGVLGVEPDGIGFNDAPNKLNIIVGEKAHSMLLINGCSVVLVDPGEGIEHMLQSYGIPLTALTALLLTHPHNLNLFECLVKLPRIILIAEETVYLQTKRQLKTSFFWTDQMIKRRVCAKVLVQSDKRHKFENMEWLVHRGKDDKLEYWQLSFGLKLLRIYPCLLEQVPPDLFTNLQLEYCVVYNLEEPVRSQLHKLPEVYRKKIIYNRVSRKHNHQYFAVFNSQHPLLSIQAHSHAESHLQLDHLASQLQRYDTSALLPLLRLQNAQLFNSTNRVVYVIAGYVQDEEQKMHGIGSKIINKKWLKCYQRATIMYELESNLYFYQRSAHLRQKTNQPKENLLLKVKDNTFIAALSKTVSPAHLTTPLQNQEEWFQQNSQWDLVNQAASLKTLESGSNELAGRQCLYLVVKGSLRLSNSEKLCGKNMGVSKIRSFLDSQLDEGEEIQVVKDTWVIEIGLKLLQNGLFNLYPQKMYELLSKPMIFS